MAPLLRACSTTARAGRTVLSLRPSFSAAAHAYLQIAAKTAPISLGSASTTGAWGAAKIGSVPSCARRGVARGTVLSPAYVDVARLGARLAQAALHPATRPGARTFFTRFAQQRQLQSLEKEAAAYPSDAAKQAEYLKKLNTHDPEAVLRRVESKHYPINQDALIEYIKALVLLGRFDRSDFQHINRIAQSNGLPELSMQEVGAVGGMGGMGGMVGGVGGNGGMGVMGAQQGYGGAGGAYGGAGGGGGGGGRGVARTRTLCSFRWLNPPSSSRCGKLHARWQWRTCCSWGSRRSWKNAVFRVAPAPNTRWRRLPSPPRPSRTW